MIPLRTLGVLYLCITNGGNLWLPSALHVKTIVMRLFDLLVPEIKWSERVLDGSKLQNRASIFKKFKYTLVKISIQTNLAIFIQLPVSSTL